MELGPWVPAVLALIIALATALRDHGRRGGITEAQLATVERRADEAFTKANKVEEAQQIRVGAVQAEVELLRSSLLQELKENSKQISEALLLIAREHPTHRQLREFKDEFQNAMKERFDDLTSDIAELRQALLGAARHARAPKRRKPAK